MLPLAAELLLRFTVAPSLNGFAAKSSMAATSNRQVFSMSRNFVSQFYWIMDSHKAAVFAHGERRSLYHE